VLTIRHPLPSKEKEASSKVFVRNDFVSFNNVNVYKAAVISVTQCNVLTARSVLFCAV
jgi:hypothetical protein